MELGEVMSFPELRQQRKPHASNLVGTALQTQLVPKQQLKSGKAAEQLVSWSRSGKGTMETWRRPRLPGRSGHTRQPGPRSAVAHPFHRPSRGLASLGPAALPQGSCLGAGGL